MTVKIMNLTSMQELHRKTGKCIAPDFLRTGSVRTRDLRHSSIQPNLSCLQNHKFIIFHFCNMQHFNGSLVSPQLLYLIDITLFILCNLSSLPHIFCFLITLTSVSFRLATVTLWSQISYSFCIFIAPE